MAFRMAFLKGAASFDVGALDRLGQSGFSNVRAIQVRPIPGRPCLPTCARICLLELLSRLDLTLALLALLLGRGQLLERRFLLQPLDPLRRHLEVQPQRSLDRDLPVAEVAVVEDLGAAILGHVAVELDDLGDVRLLVRTARSACCRGSSASSTKRSVALISWILPRRSLRLRLVSTQM